VCYTAEVSNLFIEPRHVIVKLTKKKSKGQNEQSITNHYVLLNFLANVCRLCPNLLELLFARPPLLRGWRDSSSCLEAVMCWRICRIMNHQHLNNNVKGGKKGGESVRQTDHTTHDYTKSHKRKKEKRKNTSISAIGSIVRCANLSNITTFQQN
jgi:hypothetical protein